MPASRPHPIAANRHRRFAHAAAPAIALAVLIHAIGCTNVGEERIEQTRQLDPYTSDPGAAQWLQPLAIVEDAEAAEHLREELERFKDARSVQARQAEATHCAVADTGTIAVARGELISIYVGGKALRTNATGIIERAHAAPIELAQLGGCQALALAPNGRTLVVIGTTVRAWRLAPTPSDVDAPAPAPYPLTLSIPALEARNARATCAAFSPDGQWLVVGFSREPSRPPLGNAVLVGASTPDDDRRAAGFLALWRVAAAVDSHDPSRPVAEACACVPTHERVTSLAIDGAGEWVLVGAPEALSLWRLVSDDLGGLVRTAATPWPDRATPAALTFVQTSAWGAVDAGLCVVRDGDDTRVLALPFMADTRRAEIAWPEAARVAPAPPTSTMPLVFVNDRPVASWSGTPHGHATDATGRWLLAADANEAQLWRVGASNQPYAHRIARIAGHLSPVIAVAVSSDGELAATTDTLGVTRLWRASSPPALDPTP